MMSTPAPDAGSTSSANLNPTRLAAIIDSLDDAVLCKDLAGIVTSWNGGAQRMFGYRAEEIVGQSILSLIPEERRSEEAVILARLARGESIDHFETVRVRKDGTRIDVSVSISAIRDASGRVIGASKVARDISVRKHWELNLRESEQRMRLATAATGVGIWEWNVVTQQIRWDAQMFRIYGLTPTDDGMVRYTDWTARVLPEELAEQERQLHETVVGGGAGYREFRITRPGQPEILTIEAREVVRRNAAGGVEWVVGTNLDITERKRVERALQTSEAQFRTMANSIPQLAWIAHADGHLYWYNQRWYDYTGTTPAEMEGWGWQKVHDPALLPEILIRWQAAIRAGEEMEMEFPLRGADGRMRIFLTRIVPVKDATGRVLHWFGTNTDIETVRQASRAVEESERKLRRVIDGLGPDNFLGLLSVDGVLLEANRPALAAAGLEAADVLGRPFDETFWWSHSAAVRAQLREAIARAADGQSSRFDVQVAVAGGGLVWLDFALNPVRDADGRVTFLVPSGIVIEQRVQAEAALQQLNSALEQRVSERTAQLEAANQELEAFSYSVSHDLRAPLRAINGFSQAVIEDFGTVLPAEGQRQLQVIRSSSKRMGELIDDLLAFAQLNRAEVKRWTVDHNELVQLALQELQPLPAGRTIEFKFGPLPACRGDGALLKQVWLNFLANAIKYTARRPTAVIEVGFGGQADEPAYYVKDNGCGFDMKYAAKLFGVFQRLHRAEEFEGTGVGLAIVARIVARHGGRVWAEAALDQGATFYFTVVPS